jgi:hypothetical protein
MAAARGGCLESVLAKAMLFVHPPDADRTACSRREHDPDQSLAQLFFGLICIMTISSPQYVWTLFTSPLKFAPRRYAGSSASYLFYPDRSSNIPFTLPEHQATKNWTIVFAVMIVMDFMTAIMAVEVLKPLRQKLRGRHLTLWSRHRSQISEDLGAMRA